MPMIKTRTVERFDANGNMIEREIEETKTVGDDTSQPLNISYHPHLFQSTAQFDRVIANMFRRS